MDDARKRKAVERSWERDYSSATKKVCVCMYGRVIFISCCHHTCSLISTSLCCMSMHIWSNTTFVCVCVCLFVNSEKFVYEYCMGIKLLHVHTRTSTQNCFEQVFHQKRFMVTGLILPFWYVCVCMCTRGIAFKYAHVFVVMEYVFCVRAWICCALL